MHCNDYECFEPSYKAIGAKNVGEAIVKIAAYLYAHADHIVKLGFTEEVPFTLGDNGGFILKGKNAGRKKDKRVESSS